MLLSILHPFIFLLSYSITKLNTALLQSPLPHFLNLPLEKFSKQALSQLQTKIH